MAIFALSRLVYRILGVGFDASTLGIYWQFLDPELLRRDLLESLFYLHSQPPLFNLFLGLVLKSAGPAAASVFAAIYLGLGLFCFVGGVFLMRRLGISRLPALLAAGLWTLRPSFVLVESRLMYDLPTAALLLAAALCLHRALERDSTPALHGFFWTVLGLCGGRSLFHPVFLWLTVVGAWIALTWTSTDRRAALRAIVTAAILPLLLLTTWQIKNLVLFGQSGTSSWLGMNAMRIVGSALTDEGLRALRDELSLSPAAGIPPFSALDAYPESLRDDHRFSHVEGLHQERKSTGARNFHHLAYVEISRAHGRDALRLAMERPGAYLHGVAKAWYNYFQPQSRIPHLAESRRLLEPGIDLFEALAYGEVRGVVPYGDGRKSVFVLAFLGFPGLWLYACRRTVSGSTPFRFTLGFLCAATLFVALVGNSLEVWENQRFRFYTDGFTAVFLGLALEDLRRRLQGRRLQRRRLQGRRLGDPRPGGRA